MYRAMKARYRLSCEWVVADDGTRLPVSVIGTGTPVVLLHAFGMDARQFIPFILPLLSRYRFYLPHYRGFGMASELILPQFDFIEQYATDTRAVFTHITTTTQTERVPVAGISMGALVMWAYFSRFGTDKVSRFLNIDQAPLIHHQPDCHAGVFGDKQGQMFARFRTLIAASQPYMQLSDFRHLPDGVKRALLETERDFSLLSVGSRAASGLTQLSSMRPSYRRTFYQHPTWRHKIRCLHAYTELPYDYRAVLPSVSIPVTWLIGARSTLYAATEQRKLAERLPNVDIHVLPSAGHAIPMDAPIGFYRAIKAFLDLDTDKG